MVSTHGFTGSAGDVVMTDVNPNTPSSLGTRNLGGIPLVPSAARRQAGSAGRAAAGTYC